MNSVQSSRKLILGTVQLGLPYGINNSLGKPDQMEAFKILGKARSYNIEILDSADAYGDSLEIIGRYHKENKQNQFKKVISKFIHDDTPLTQKVQKTLEGLAIDRLYVYMYHRYLDYVSGRNHKELIDLKKNNKIEQIGLSVYHLQEFMKAIDDETISVIQIPYNPFDASSQKRDLLKRAKQKGKEIHVRSIFLQGLFFKNPEDLLGNLTELRNPLHNFHQIRTDYNLSVMQACLNFALGENHIDYVLIGVETELQLDQNIDSILPVFPEDAMERLSKLQVENTSLLNPSNWKL